MSVFRNTFLVMLLLALVTGCGSNKDELDDLEAERLGEQKLYEKARAKLDSGNYDLAIRAYQRVAIYYPFGPYAEQSQLEVIYAHIKSYNYDEAVVAAEVFLRQHPQHPSADYALYLKGLANFYTGQGILDRYISKDFTSRDPSNYRQAFVDFAYLLQIYPNSEYGPDAKARMIFLRNVLAWHELNVANYYLKRKAWIAALDRAKGIVENYQQTPAVSDALAIMTQTYLILDLDDLARDSEKVLVANYPDYPALKNGAFVSQYDPNRRSWKELLSFNLFDLTPAPRFEHSKKEYLR